MKKIVRAPQVWGKRSALCIPSFWVVQFWPWHQNIKILVTGLSMMGIAILFIVLGSYYSDKYTHPDSCCISSAAPNTVNWGSCRDPHSTINASPFTPNGFRIQCSAPVTSYALTLTGCGVLIIYVAGMIYAMLHSRSVTFHKLFFLAPEFLLLFLHAFRAKKWKQAVIGVILAFVYVFTTFLIGIILTLQYGWWYCYDWNADLSTMETPCTGGISTSDVFTTWLRAWPYIIVNLLSLAILVVLHIALYKEIK